MKSSVAARGCERAAVQDMRLGMEPRTPVGARLSPPICRLSVWYSGVRQWRPPPTFQVLLRETDRQVLRAQGGSWRLRDDNLWNLIPLGDFWRGSVARQWLETPRDSVEGTDPARVRLSF